MGNGRRGRMINASNRRQAVELIKEAVDSGAALYKACAELGISRRTYNRWKNTDSDYIDKRTICARPEPANKLTMEEKRRYWMYVILKSLHQKHQVRLFQYLQTEEAI